MPRGGSVTWLKALVLGVFAALLSTGASPFFGAAAPVRSAPTSWVVSGPDFANGTFQNTTLAANGSLELAARARPSNRTMVLDVGAPGSADSSYLTAPCVLREANGPYEMWYTGVSGGGYSILLATSPDGVNWTKKGVVLSGVLTPSTLKIGATYHMWYALYMQGSGPLGYTDEIYHATSPDGVAWNVQGLALGLGPTGSWDAAIVAYPWVVQDSGGLYRLYYTGFDTSGNVQVGVATSRDLQNWTRFPLNPVLAAGASGSWDTHVSTHSVVLLGSEWIAYYEGAQPGGNGQIGSATSLDGYNWTKNPANPTIPPEPAPAWDDLGLGTPDLLLDPSGPRIYYNGGNGGPFRIGLYRFGPPRAETYSGWYVSAVFDSREAGTIWHSLAANATAVPGTSVSFRARAGNTSTPTGTWTTWTPSARLTSLPPTRFLQVRADFLSDAWNTTAFLTKISVDYGPNVPGGAAEGTVLGIPIWSLFLLALVAGVGVVTVVVVLLSLRGERRRPPMG